MARNTGIEWTHYTWNPWHGCKKVSTGCRECYMYTAKRRYGQDPKSVVRATNQTFFEPLRWHEEGLVFTCSWSDWFIAEADEWRDEAWDVIRQCPHLTFQILTKRPERIAGHLPPFWGDQGWPNVWLGVSVEDQRYADQRIPILAEIPAVVRFISAEPLLGPINLTNHIGSLDWVIAGGESGPRYRELDLDWARGIRDVCRRAKVPFFFKQIGGPNSKSGGNLLDGRQWLEMPKTRRVRPWRRPNVRRQSLVQLVSSGR